ncbi:hypothetical protein FTUN_2766 [Frigoriglobus tundricola]|uniref:Uncharacterized protein n=1 Tax=Frigoriglobus tundricola TaxID=2774151 RepID=A0A6M5YP04_9BACT|nr:hypothetical protein FTUN_2766 [Frigoriglobus tundricola]
MIALPILKCAALLLSATPAVPMSGQPPRIAPLPKPPQQLHDEIVNQQTAFWQKVLSATENLRKHYENSTTAEYSVRIAELKRIGADCKRRLEGLGRSRWRRAHRCRTSGPTCQRRGRSRFVIDAVAPFAAPGHVPGLLR